MLEETFSSWTKTPQRGLGLQHFSGILTEYEPETKHGEAAFSFNTKQNCNKVSTDLNQM